MHGCLAGRWLHPLSVWDAVCCGGLSRQQLLAGLPRHFQQLLCSILDALTEQYCSVQRELQLQLSAGPCLHWAWSDQLLALLDLLLHIEEAMHTGWAGLGQGCAQQALASPRRAQQQDSAHNWRGHGSLPDRQMIEQAKSRCQSDYLGNLKGTLVAGCG
jgi:hypothetical protein